LQVKAGWRFLVTCEHGGNRIPARYRPLFARHGALLASHRGYDPGALALARDFASALGAELVYSTTSRLLVELNRSSHHRKLFSEIARGLSQAEQDRILARYYLPYREWVEAQVDDGIASGGRLLHLSCHSFTPNLNGIERRADIGLLYDPRRAPELAFCTRWQREIQEEQPSLLVRRNYPYRGSDDGLTTWLRRRYPQSAYAGIELEVNQKFPLGNAQAWRAMRQWIVASFERAARTSPAFGRTSRYR
jgi:predicted N-formylglutamate amidohydrolase